MISLSHGSPITEKVLGSVEFKFQGYGYQIWTENFEDPRGTFYLAGGRGQRIAINPERQQMMVVFSMEENYMGMLYQLFASWK